MALDHRHLEVFLAVVKHGSLGRAAQALNRSQPAVSKAIGRLEELLEVPLFERTPRGMLPTLYGEALQAHAELITFEAGRARDEIEALRGVSKGTVRIGAAPSIVGGVLYQAALALLAERPGLRLHVIEGIEGTLLQALLRGEIDVAIAGGMRRIRDYPVTTELLYTDRVVVVCRPGHPLTRNRRRPALADLLRFPWALTDRDNVMWRRLSEFFYDAGLDPPEAAIETTSANFMKAVAAHSDFLTYLPRQLIRSEEAEGRLRPLSAELAVWVRQVVLMRRREGSLSPATQSFLRDLRRAAEALGRALR